MFFLNKGVILRQEKFGGLIYNMYTNRYFELNKEGYSILLNLIENQNYNLNSDFTYDLIKNKIITENSINGKGNIIKNQTINDKSYTTSPVEAFLYITNNCNQKCSFCYMRHVHDNTNLDFEKWKNIVDKLTEGGVCTIGYMGGEPFASKNLLFCLLDYLNGKVHQVITTNGTYQGGITQNMAKKLNKYSSLEIGISIHSHIEECHDKVVCTNGSYNIAVKTIKNLLESGKKDVFIKHVVTVDNYKNLYEFVCWAKELGVSGVQIFEYLPSLDESFYSYSKKFPKKELYLAILEKTFNLRSNEFFIIADERYSFVVNKTTLDGFTDLQKKMKICPAGLIKLNVLSDGSCYSCDLTNNREEYCLGNLLVDSLQNIWNNDKLDIFRNNSKEISNNSACKVCKYDCNGGCPILSRAFTGAYYNGDYSCPILRDNIICN